jgi:hypothetical protein
VRLVPFILVAVATLAACEKEEPVREVPLNQMSQNGRLPSTVSQPAATQPDAQGMGGGMAAAPTGGSGNSVAGITWTAPSSWQVRGPAPMRVATYSIPAVAGDSEPGELAVFFFGAGQGGDVQANLQRWYGQIEQPDGKPTAQVAKTGERTVNGVKVTTVAVDGTYLAATRPMSQEKTKKPGFRLLGAIAEAPEGAVFFKLTAPKKTAEAAGFDAFVGTIHK